MGSANLSQTITTFSNKHPHGERQAMDQQTWMALKRPKTEEQMRIFLIKHSILKVTVTSNR
jgi:hypothetical protein